MHCNVIPLRFPICSAHLRNQLGHDRQYRRPIHCWQFLPLPSLIPEHPCGSGKGRKSEAKVPPGKPSLFWNAQTLEVPRMSRLELKSQDSDLRSRLPACSTSHLFLVGWPWSCALSHSTERCCQATSSPEMINHHF